MESGIYLLTDMSYGPWETFKICFIFDTCDLSSGGLMHTACHSSVPWNTLLVIVWNLLALPTVQMKAQIKGVFIRSLY